MKLNKFELIRFALRAESTIFPNGRLDCINGNFHTEDAKRIHGILQDYICGVSMLQ